MDVLNNILKHKQTEIASARSRVPFEQMMELAKETQELRPFRETLCQEYLSVIAEIKKASPSRGVITENFQPTELANEFEQGGASALSVLTDVQFFQGDQSYIKAVKSSSSLPVLRKDFIIDEYQVYESRAIGADAILLIVSALSREKLYKLYDVACSLGLAVLVEVHSKEELQQANDLKAGIIGINNRNLSTFQVSLSTSFELRSLIHDTAIAVSESGIATVGDVQQLRKAGFDAILVGESLMKASHRGTALKELVQG